MLMNSMQRT